MQQLGIGGDFHCGNVRGRLMTQFGMYSTMTPRNDASPARGQWKLDDAYRYISEAYGGYHWNKMNGINVDAGIFMSYVGLFSYYNFDNWAYQPSYVSSNTPWFFNGMRAADLSERQAQDRAVAHQRLAVVRHVQRGAGRRRADPVAPERLRCRCCRTTTTATTRSAFPIAGALHTDNSLEVKYYDDPKPTFDKGAFSLTVDAGCESGGGVSCTGGTPARPKQNFLGFMVYNRSWFDHDQFGLTLGGGAIDNPGPLSRAAAADQRRDGVLRHAVLHRESRRSVQGVGRVGHVRLHAGPVHARSASRSNHRAANVPYFAGPGGVTPVGRQHGTAGIGRAELLPGSAQDRDAAELRAAGEAVEPRTGDELAADGRGGEST